MVHDANPGGNGGRPPTPQQVAKKLCNAKSEQEQEKILRQLETHPELLEKVLLLLDKMKPPTRSGDEDELIEFPEEIDEDIQDQRDEEEDAKLDRPPIRTRGKKGHKFKTNKQWHNWLKTTEAQPLRYYTPTELDDIQAIVQIAEALGHKVRAFGSGHGLSDIAMTSDFLIDTSKLQRVLPLPKNLKEAHKDDHFFNIEAGMKIKRLNRKLKKAGLALTNMGGSDVQSVVGAISTSTHGSGIKLGPLPSMVKSLEMVTTGGEIYRIEPCDGITDPLKYDETHRRVKLIQDDTIFNAVVVSMGCMGIIYSLIIEVEPAYMLKETRKIYKWSALKPMLKEGKIIRNNRHFEMIINPHETDHDHNCIVTTRNYYKGTRRIAKKDRQRDFLPSFISSLKITPPLFVRYFKIFPYRIPVLINRALKGLEDKQFTNASYKVLNQGSGQLKFIGCAVELGFDMDNYIEAIEKIFEIAARFRRVGKQYLTSPFGVRFVAKSDAHMSMMNKGETVMIEVPTLKGTAGWRDMVKSIQSELTSIGGIPHWGLDFAQANGNSIERLKEMYPNIETWLDVLKRFNAKGTFNNTFTDRMGFSQ